MGEISSNKGRIGYIDRIKVLGLFLVILAHVDLPIWLSQIRSFDVPLLVFASAYLARYSYSNTNVSLYYRKRFIRLAVPAWIFALFFWCVQTIVFSAPDIKEIIKSLLFQRDTYMIGMLWVIWVYIICALLIPIINKIGYNLKSSAVIIILLAIFQVLCTATELSDYRILYCTLFTVIPYGFMTWLGYYYNDMGKKQKMVIAGFSVIIFVALATVLSVRKGSFALISDYKYPAQVYYLSYAIPFVFVLFEFLPKLDKYYVSSLTRFISRSSLWIYLWHMLILYAVKMFIQNSSYWWMQYILIVVISVFIVWVQNKVIDFIFEKTKWKWLSVFKG